MQFNKRVEKIKKIEDFKKRLKSIDFKNLKFEDIINIENIANLVSNYIANYKKHFIALDNFLINMSYNNYKIANKIIVKLAKKINCMKNQYFFITKEMIQNIKINTNKKSQFFADCTCYIVP